MLYIDGKGHEFKSLSKMCAEWGITKALFNERMKMGWGLKKSLETPAEEGCGEPIKVHKEEIVHQEKKWVDHLGKEYVSFEEMCRHYRLDTKTVRCRIKKYRWSLGKALTEPVYKQINKRRRYETVVFDAEYDSLAEAARELSVSLETIHKYKKRLGITSEKALEYVVEKAEKNKKGNEVGIVVFGRRYKSIVDAVKNYSLDMHTVYYTARKLGMDIKDAIECLVDQRSEIRIDNDLDSIGNIHTITEKTPELLGVTSEDISSLRDFMDYTEQEAAEYVVSGINHKLKLI